MRDVLRERLAAAPEHGNCYAEHIALVPLDQSLEILDMPSGQKRRDEGRILVRHAVSSAG